MKYLVSVVLLAVAFLTSSSVRSEESGSSESPIANLPWHSGPGSERIGSQAVIKTDADLSFLDEASSRKFLELTGNIPEDGLYVLASKSKDWWATFTFNPMGYVKDDDKIDADELLASIKSGDEASNEERKRLGISALYTDGWAVPPHYDSESKRLEWGVRLISEGQPVVNYTVRILGRTGVMNATLVADPETLQADVQSFKTSLTGFEFNSGERYAEFHEGDRVAEYGLAALVVGGGAAIAAKSGLLAKFWKLIVLGVAGLAGFVKKLFGRKSSR
ncbi:MAG: DUF2167 domain-containing protein [Xanthomonadales bacterium]|nr:DUF2167 domain-containing protein [Xanthomonadales bacterium]